MEKLGKIGLVNIVLLFIYSAIIRLSGDGYHMFELAFLISLHFMLCLTAGLILVFSKHKPIGLQLILSSILVLLIGFGTCWGLFNMKF